MPGGLSPSAALGSPAEPREDGVGESVLDSARLEAARVFAAVVEEIGTGKTEFPQPGSGRTAHRFAALRDVAERDLCAARLVEGHVDATAILVELGAAPPAPGERWGVWAAEPPGEGLTATRVGAGWEISGRKQYCSGAHSCTHALVTAQTPDGKRLFAVETSAPGYAPVPGTWQALGMAGSDTPDVRFTGVPAVPVGPVGGYLDRPGFQHGGIGVAACWYGGAVAVSRTLHEAARRHADPHTDAHLGTVDAQLHAAWAVLEQAGAEIDHDPEDVAGVARVRSLRVRAFVESVCAHVLTHVGRATGAGPLCHDPQHARNAADLSVYIRQHHAERNLAELGALLARPEALR
ncbi:acyl-CoA dehydrogenase family protein [Streptomyces xanthochromogenes]|uniref:acyl-CoA dehydrogenase family protein n=1 Tax=Streptomyces xanthochromogenes TaxID=67384 RepID=UPI003418B3E1